MGRRTGILESGRVLYLPLGSIRPNPAQPRRVFDPAGLQELADSIREYGILQPLTAVSYTHLDVYKRQGLCEDVQGTWI